MSKREACVVHPSQVFRLVFHREFFEELVRATRDGSILAAAVDERLCTESEERPINQRVSIDEEKARARRRRHGENLTCRGPGLGRSGPACLALSTVGECQAFTTFAADRPFSPALTSNSTGCPSARVLNPSMLMDEKWTKTSSPPSCSMKP